MTRKEKHAKILTNANIVNTMAAACKIDADIPVITLMKKLPPPIIVDSTSSIEKTARLMVV